MLILSRDDWKAVYRQMRIDAKARFQRSNFAGSTVRLIHGSTYWTARIDVQGSRMSLDAYPSTIRDRAPWARIGHDLAWAGYYRERAKVAARYSYGNAPNVYCDVSFRGKAVAQ